MSDPVIPAAGPDRTALYQIDAGRYRRRVQYWTCPGMPNITPATMRRLIDAGLAHTWETEFLTVMVRPTQAGKDALAILRQRQRKTG